MTPHIILLFLVVPLTVFGFQEPHYCKLADNVTNAHVNQMRSKGFQMIASGGGFMDDINLISMRFISSKHATIDEARKLYVQATQNLLSGINTDVPIQPYLHHRPFSISDLKYGLSFEPQSAEEIAYVSNSDNTVYYARYFWNADRKDTEIKTVFKEPYDEAVKIVQGMEEKREPVPPLGSPAN